MHRLPRAPRLPTLSLPRAARRALHHPTAPTRAPRARAPPPPAASARHAAAPRPRTRPLSTRPTPAWPSRAPRARAPAPRRGSARGGYTHFGGGPAGGGAGAGGSRRLAYVLGASAAGAAVYVYVNLDYAPFTGRARLLGVSRRAELALGRQAFDDVLRSFEGRILHPNHPDSRRVRRIVSKIAGTVLRIDPALSDGFEWQAVVADTDEPNALCVPGGRILITTGLLRILPTEDDIAIVLGHEIAHALNRHGAESMHLQRLLMPIVFIANQVFDMRWLPSVLLTVFLSLPYKRSLEYEADDVGLQLCAEACYDPRAAPGVFQRLAALQDEKTGTFLADRVAPFLSTHPQSKERAARLKAAVPKRMERYNDKCMTVSDFTQFVQDYPAFQFPERR